MIDTAAADGLQEVVIGMPHRGRLSVLVNILGKPMAELLHEFLGSKYDAEKIIKDQELGDWTSAGDVKYHLGVSRDRTYGDGAMAGRSVHMKLMPNPSHLEVVAPVAIGKARAIQFHGGAADAHKKVMPIVMHGDAAFAGQGVVYETFQLNKVEDFNVGGTLHVVVNNQVGFTTDPWRSRSTPYCSDIAKGFNAPVFHVNADDAMACAYAFETAAEFRQTFGRDVVIDLVCYRRLGHNEGDNPDFTQPELYRTIAKHPSVEAIASERFVAEGWMTAEDVAATRAHVAEAFEKSWDDAHNWNPLDKSLSAPMLTRGTYSVASPIVVEEE